MKVKICYLMAAVEEYFVQLFVALMSVTMVTDLEGSSDAAEGGKEMLRNRYLFDPTHKAGRK